MLADKLISRSPSGGTGFLSTRSADSYEIVTDVAVDSLDYSYAIGYYEDTRYIPIVIKYDPTGNVVWQKSFGSDVYPQTNYKIRPLKVRVKNNSIFIVSAVTYIPNTAYEWTMVTKFDLNGNAATEQNTTIFAYLNKILYPTGIDVDSNSNVYLTMYGIMPNTTQAQHSVVVKLSSNLNDVIWTAKITNTIQPTFLKSIHVDEARGFVYAGGTYLPKDGTFSNNIVVKLRMSDGIVLLKKTFRFGYYGNDFEGIKTDSNGFVYACGTTMPASSGSNHENASICKIDPASLNVIWAYDFRSSFTGQDAFHDIDIDLNDNIYLSGMTIASSTQTVRRLLLIRMDSSGSLIRQRALTTYETRLAKCQVNNKGNVFITCDTNFSKDFFIAKMPTTFTDIRSYGSLTSYNPNLIQSNIPTPIYTSYATQNITNNTYWSDTYGIFKFNWNTLPMYSYNFQPSSFSKVNF